MLLAHDMNLSSIEQTLVNLIRPTLHQSGESFSLLDPGLAESDWALLVQQAIGHRLAPLLSRVLVSVDWRMRVPKDAIAKLDFEFMRTNVTNLMVYRQLDSLLDRFQQMDIPIILLKGVALAQNLYSDIALRPMSDLDVLVMQSDFDRACESFDQDGYKRFLEPGQGFQQDYYSVAGFASPRQGHVPIEIHQHLFHFQFYRQRIPIEWFWTKTELGNFQDRQARVFSPTAQLLHLASHLVLGHQDYGLGWLYDIALLVNRFGKQIEWQELGDVATQFGLGYVVQSTLAEVEHVWGVVVPAQGRDCIVRLKPTLTERWFVMVNTARFVEAGELWNIANQGSWHRALGYLQTALFPGSTYMQERYHITDARLVPFYYIWRLGRGFGMFVRSAWSISLNVLKRTLFQS